MLPRLAEESGSRHPAVTSRREFLSLVSGALKMSGSGTPGNVSSQCTVSSDQASPAQKRSPRPTEIADPPTFRHFCVERFAARVRVALIHSERSSPTDDAASSHNSRSYSDTRSSMRISLAIPSFGGRPRPRCSSFSAMSTMYGQNSETSRVND